MTMIKIAPNLTVAMDFVGNWFDVRGRDRDRLNGFIDAVRTAMDDVNRDYEAQYPVEEQP